MRQKIEIVEISSIYHTAPRGFKFQPSFLNQVISGRTILSPKELLEIIKETESQLGRVRLFPNSPRTIDIDLLFYNNLVMNSDMLAIPHPQIMHRAFVLVPLVEIAPQIRHPVSGLTMTEILENVDTSGVKRWK